MLSLKLLNKRKVFLSICKYVTWLTKTSLLAIQTSLYLFSISLLYQSFALSGYTQIRLMRQLSQTTLMKISKMHFFQPLRMASWSCGIKEMKSMFMFWRMGVDDLSSASIHHQNMFLGVRKSKWSCMIWEWWRSYTRSKRRIQTTWHM